MHEAIFDGPDLMDPTRLVAAIRADAVSVVGRALRAGMNPNCKTPDGYTPLMIAAGLSRAHLVEALLGAGADPNVLDSRIGNSALHLAAQGGSGEVARLLIARGAFVNLQNPSQGHTPLIDAIIYKSPRVVAVLLEAGANTEIKNNWGFGAADFLANMKPHGEADRPRVEAIQADFAARRAADKKRKEGMRLFQAVLADKIGEVEAALAAGDDVNQVHPVEQGGNDGHTPLLAAARDGHDAIARRLLGAGADPYIPDYLYKAFPIFKSAYMGKRGTAQAQIDAGVDLDVQGPWNGYTPLHDALWQGHVDVAEALVAAGASVTLRALNGRTAVDIAVETFGEGHPITALVRSRVPA